jgi:hypothetical protein
VEVVIYDNGELNEMVNQRVVRTGMLFVLCAVHAGMRTKEQSQIVFFKKMGSFENKREFELLIIYPCMNI